MPHNKSSAGRQHRHARRSQTERVVRRALDIEEPLREAMDFVHALRQIGNGMMSLSEDDGRPIVAVAQAAGERLDRLHDAWLGLLRVARR
jgi:hypothetical protein